MEGVVWCGGCGVGVWCGWVCGVDGCVVWMGVVNGWLGQRVLSY